MKSLRAIMCFGLTALALLVWACEDGRGGETDADADVETPDQPDAEPDASEDRDGDGLSNDAEEQGWTIEVDENGDGETESRHVTSDPDSADTDGDGLTDAEEQALRTDPTRADTDGDGLSDYEEINVYGSDPTDVDTDDDARGPDGDLPPNSNFFDGAELDQYGTSPTLDDTDGDGMTDFEEIMSAGFKPLVADTPLVRVSIEGMPSVVLDVTYTEGSEVESMEYAAELERRQSALSTTDSESTQVTINQSREIQTSVEASFWPPGGSMSVTATMSWSRGVTQEDSYSVTRDSVSEAQNEYQQSLTNERAYGEASSTGSITIGFKVVNEGDVTFTINNLQITALKHDVDNPGSFKVLTSLEPPIPETGYEITPGSATGSLMASVEDVSASLIKELLRNPSGLFFDVAYFDLYDESGESYGAIAEAVASRTALLIIDYGDASTDRFGHSVVERAMVATNVTREPDGTPAGVSMPRAMEILGLDYETDPETGALTRLRHVETGADAAEGFWIVLASSDTAGENFEDMILKNRDVVSLVFMRDKDGDRLFDREEYFYGTSDEPPDGVDTDGDGLTDFDEVREGWIMLRTGEGVFSSPVTVDADEDGLRDDQEKELGTDPNDPDSDRDGMDDGKEAADGTDPHSTDTDGDTLPDGQDLHPLLDYRTAGPGVDAWQVSPYAFSGQRETNNGVVYHEGYAYVVGNGTPEIQRAPISRWGVVGPWEEETSTYGESRYGHAAVVNGDHLYVIAGEVGSTHEYRDNVFISRFDPETGHLLAWSEASYAMPQARSFHAGVAYNSYLYAIGGRDSGWNELDSIVYARINPDGTLGPWQTATNPLTSVRTWPAAVAHNGYLYVLGGYEDTSVFECTDVVEVAPILASGDLGAWQSTTPMSHWSCGHVAAESNGHLYVVGGGIRYEVNMALDQVIHAEIQSDGSLGGWVASAPLPRGRINASGFALNEFLFIFGGWIDDEDRNDVLFATFSAP